MEKSLTDFIGQELELIEMSSGHISLKIGDKYKVIDVFGCCFNIRLKDGSTAIINHKKFKK